MDERFEIMTLIGEGMYGVVYRAVDRQTDEQVALKMLAPKVGNADPGLAGRFRREAEICRTLTHKNTAQLRGYGNFDDAEGVPYLIFDLVRGLPLGFVMQARGPLNAEETAYVLAEVCDSLHEAHSQGIMHRDLKPDNIMIVAEESRLREPRVDGRIAERLGIPDPRDDMWKDLTRLRVKVLDFGLGKALEIGDPRNVAQLTEAGMLPGTAHYVSPEQLRPDAAVDHRADIYAVGILVYRLMAGEPPFRAKTAAAICVKHVSEELPALPSLGAIEPIEAVYRRAAAKEPADRYQTAAELATALRRTIDPSYDPAATAASGQDGKKKGFWSRLFGR